MFCTNCGSQMVEGNAFCIYCGSLIQAPTRRGARSLFPCLSASDSTSS